MINPCTLHWMTWNYAMSGELGSTKQSRDPISLRSAVLTCNGCSHTWTAVAGEGFDVFLGLADVACPRCRAEGVIDGEQLQAVGG